MNLKKLSKLFNEQTCLIVYIAVVGAGLVVAVLMLSGIVSSATTTSDSDPVQLDFQQTLIDKVNNIKTADAVNEAPDLASDRINPLSE